jgi:two-component system, NarL family, nitrate/nitrite response regulator NarL
MKHLSLLLIEDNRLLRNSIISMLKNQRDIKLTDASENIGLTALKIRMFIPDIILLGLGIFNRNSVKTVELTQNNYPDSKLILIDFEPGSEDIHLFIKAGADGFILKDATIKDFIHIIHTVAESCFVHSPDLMSAVSGVDPVNNKYHKSTLMTKRECEVIEWISVGLTNKEISYNMNVSTFTVKTHIHNIMEKLTLHSRLELANFTYSSELKN